MINIADILSPKHILLDMNASTPGDAIYQVAALLQDDDRVLDWNEFYALISPNATGVLGDSQTGMCIPHARTRHVSGMVMAVGRSSEGIWFEEQGIRAYYIFVIGIPFALASDYLRIIGALARILRSPNSESALRHAATPHEFLQRLSESEIAF